MQDLERSPRPLRWYEWLALLLLAGYAAGARADVYQCTGARGEVAFQSRPCADTVHQSVIAIAPAPTYAASPEYAVEPARGARSAHGVERVRQPVRRSESRPAGSYECRTSDGQVFYRHSTCPRSVPAASQDGTHRGRRGGAGGAAAKSVAVTATRISREDACYELRRAAAAGRSGRIHDQDVSSYDKNLGRDPCR